MGIEGRLANLTFTYLNLLNYWWFHFLKWKSGGQSLDKLIPAAFSYSILILYGSDSQKMAELRLWVMHQPHDHHAILGSDLMGGRDRGWYRVLGADQSSGDSWGSISLRRKMVSLTPEGDRNAFSGWGRRVLEIHHYNRAIREERKDEVFFNLDIDEKEKSLPEENEIFVWSFYDNKWAITTPEAIKGF